MVSESLCRPGALAAFVLLAFTTVLAGSSVALAGPWVVPEGVLVTSLSAGTNFASEEHLFDGQRQAYPLGGRFTEYYLDLQGTYGLSHGVEVFGGLQLKGVSYTSDPVILLEDPANPPSDLAGYRERVFDFSRSRTGLGDIRAGVGYQHLDWPFHLASAVSLKIPTGYDEPQETFTDANLNPNDVADDVALGDGQVDADYHLHVGKFFGATFTLLQLDLGYRARFNGPGHQALAALKIGQGVDERLVFFVEGDVAYTLFDGEVLGTAAVARDPSRSAATFDTGNVDLVDFRLDKSWVLARGGAILKLGGREVVLTVQRTIWGENFPVLTGVSVSTVLVFD